MIVTATAIKLRNSINWQRCRAENCTVGVRRLAAVGVAGGVADGVVDGVVVACSIDVTKFTLCRSNVDMVMSVLLTRFGAIPIAQLISRS